MPDPFPPAQLRPVMMKERKDGDLDAILQTEEKR